MLLGDINIHLNNLYNKDVIQFHEICNAIGLQQHIKKETHISGSTLDLVLNERGNSEKILDVQAVL